MARLNLENLSGLLTRRTCSRRFRLQRPLPGKARSTSTCSGPEARPARPRPKIPYAARPSRGWCPATRRPPTPDPRSTGLRARRPTPRTVARGLRLREAGTVGTVVAADRGKRRGRPGRRRVRSQHDLRRRASGAAASDRTDSPCGRWRRRPCLRDGRARRIRPTAPHRQSKSGKKAEEGQASGETTGQSEPTGDATASGQAAKQTEAAANGSSAKGSALGGGCRLRDRPAKTGRKGRNQGRRSGLGSADAGGPGRRTDAGIDRRGARREPAGKEMREPRHRRLRRSTNSDRDACRGTCFPACGIPRRSQGPRRFARRCR